MSEIFKLENDSLIINFETLFEKPKLEVYDQFDLSAKRNFKMIAGNILDTYKSVFLNEDDEGNETFKENLSFCMLNILNCQSKIMRNSDLTTQNFLSLIDTVITCAGNSLLNEIDKLIAEGYGLTLDETTKKMKKEKKSVNDQLIISDSQAKVLIKIAYIDRLMIPLISQYYIYNKSSFPDKSSIILSEDDDPNDLVFEEINQLIFLHIFNTVAGADSENILQKIYKLCYSRIILTSQNSKKFWNVAKNDGITKESASFDIYSKLISNSIPKIQLNKDLNLVNFLSTIIRNQIMFLFSNKFKTHYQTINPSSTDGSLFESNDDNMSELEKLENHLSRKNEGSLIINRLSSDDVLNHIDEIFDVPISNEEINNNLAYVHSNPIQERIVSLLTYKHFNNTESIKQLNIFEYTKVLLCCAKYLEQRKFVLLPKLLLSKCIKEKERNSITGNKIKMQIESAKRYKELLTKKYNDFQIDVEKNIQSMIATIYNSSFVDLNGNDVFDASAKIIDLANEIIEFAFLI